MSYELFLEMVKETLIKYFPAKYQDWEVMIQRKAKINGVGDAILLKRDRSFGVLPGIYVQDMYQAYMEGCPLLVVMQNCAKLLTEALEEETKRNAIMEAAFDVLEHPEERIVFQLINTEKNEELLKLVPHRDFLDMSIVYSLEMEHGRIRIDHTLAERIGYSEYALYHAAMKNCSRLNPYVIEPMRDLIIRLLEMPELYDMTEAEVDEILGGYGVLPDRPSMWYVSNVNGCYGATGILYEDVLKKVADVTGGDYYVIPSSVHEAVILRTNDIGPSEVREIHMNIGEGENLGPGEFLSDQVYVYRLEIGRLGLAN